MLRYGDPEEVGMSAERVRRISGLARGWVEDGGTQALVVLAARHGKIVLHDAFGRLGPEPDAPPVELDTVFPLASITKTITATLAMILVDDGLLGLNRPVQEYVPEFVGEDKERVMVHHLLTHTSGLTEDTVEAHLKAKGEPGAWSYREGRYPDRDEWLAAFVDAPLTRPPGVEMVYCNHGMEMVGEIVQRVSGAPIEDFARRHLFDALGMDDTWYVVPPSADHRIVRRPPDSPVAFVDTEWYRRSPRACGGVCSTAGDLASFGQMILGGGTVGGVRILSRASLVEMTRNQIPGISSRLDDEFFPEASWGLGWNVEAGKKSLRRPTLFSDQAISHGGVGGVFIWIDPGYDLVGVYLSVCLESYSGGARKIDADLFANAITAAVVDV